MIHRPNQKPTAGRLTNAMSESNTPIKTFLAQQGFPLPDEAWADFQRIWETDTFKRKAIITRAGETEKYLYFVKAGVQRVYYHDDQDREATIVFTYPHSFAGVLDSFMLQAPSKYYFESLTHSVLLKTTYKKFHETLNLHPALQAFSHNLLNHVLSGLLERIAELQCFSSEEKFRKLLQRSPHILQHVPQKYLANYLGIDPTNFSKLMNSVKL